VNQPLPPTVYLVRHASPDRTTGIRYDVPPGPPILPKGEDEARRIGAFLREAGVRKMYVSPMQRTQQTAEIAARAAGEITATMEESIIEWTRGETAETVLERMRSFWQRAGEESQQVGPIALISHGGPIRTLVEHLGLHPDELEHYRKQFDYGNPMPPGGIWLTTRSAPDAEWHVELVFTPEPYTPFTVDGGQPADVKTPDHPIL